MGSPFCQPDTLHEAANGKADSGIGLSIVILTVTRVDDLIALVAQLVRKGDCSWFQPRCAGKSKETPYMP